MDVSMWIGHRAYIEILDEGPGHIAFDRTNNTLLSNLFVRMLHHMDIEATSFGASTGIISEV